MKPLLVLAATLSAGPALAFAHPVSETNIKHGLTVRMQHGSDEGGEESCCRSIYEGEEGMYDENNYRDGEYLGQNVYHTTLRDHFSAQELEELVQDAPGPIQGAAPEYPPPRGSGGVMYDAAANQRVVFYDPSDEELYEDVEEYLQGIGGPQNPPPQRFSQFTPQQPSTRDLVRHRARLLAQQAGTVLRHGVPPVGEYRTMQSPMTPQQSARLSHDALDPFAGQAMGTTSATTTTTYEYIPPPDSVPPPHHAPSWNGRPEEVPEEQDTENPINTGGLTIYRGYAPYDESYDRPPDEKWQVRRRRSVVASISKEEGATASGKTNSSAAASAQFQRYLDAYQTIQTNISDSLFPFFDIILNGTNNQILYEMVWSVYSDLTDLGPKIIGPFRYGQHSFDWLEDRYFGNKTNVTSMTIDNSTDPTAVAFLATNALLVEFYNFAWTNATAIANKTGLLLDKAKVGSLLFSMNASIAPAAWTAPQRWFDDSYFTNRNRTMRTSPAGNSTA